jgi:nitric oxide reductase activation protein
MMDGNRINSAKEVAFVLSESMKSIDGVKVSVFGHTAQTADNSNVEITCYKKFEQSDTSGIFEMNAKQQNLDGHAIKYVAKKFANDSNFDKKIMFVISDGEPEGYGYSGESAIKHTGSVCEFCRKKMGVDIIGIGVDSAFSSKVADKLYGKNKSIVLDNVKKSLSVMARYIRQITLKM